MGDGSYGIDPGIIRRIASEVTELNRNGIEIALVVDGGATARLSTE